MAPRWLEKRRTRFNTWLHHSSERRAYRSWHDYPLGREQRATADEYRKRWRETAAIQHPQVDAFEAECSYTIDPEWLGELALHTQVVIKRSALCWQHGRVLYSALRRYLSGRDDHAVTIWETGTARGFSAICMARALADHQRAGRIVTFDIIPHRTEMFWNCIDDVDGPKTRSDLLQPWRDLVAEYVLFQQGDTRVELPKVTAERVNFAFLDGAHTYEDVQFEFEQIRDLQEPGDVIVYDDYTPEHFPGIVRAVDEICRAHRYEAKHLQAAEARGYVVAIKQS